MNRITTALIAGGLTLGLAACGSDEPEPEAAPSTTAATESSAPAEEESEDEGGAVAAEFSEPGTELEFGEQAVVPFVSMDFPGALGVTVTGITAGTVEDLAALDLGDRISGMTPYYVTVEVTNVSGSDFSFSSLGSTNPLLADGSNAQKLSIIGEFPPCDDQSAGADFTTEGATYTTCLVGLAGEGSEVTGAEYTGTGSYTEEIPGSPEYNSDGGIRWMK